MRPPPASGDDAARSKLVLHPWLGLRDALLAAYGNVLGYAAAQVDVAATAPDRAVHEFRKSVRRARAVVRVARPLVGKEAAAALTAGLRAALGTVSSLRDADVLLATLEGLDLPDACEPARAAVREALAAEAAAVRGAADPGALLRSAVGLLPGPSRLAEALPLHVDRAALDAGRERLRRRARKALRAAEKDPVDDRIHDVRKRVKELRYALELFADPAAPRSETHRGMARLAEELGKVTDRIVLVRRIEAQASGAVAAPLVLWLEKDIQRGFARQVRAAKALTRK